MSKIGKNTFIGIGLDFNTELIEAISKVKGSNYYAVHSADDFMTRMDDEFEYMVKNRGKSMAA